NLRMSVILLAIPMMLEMMMESVFALVDLYFVGHLENSSYAVQTVGLTESVLTIIYSIAIGISMAATAVVARRIGEKDPAAAAKAGMQAILIAVSINVVISILGFVYATEILMLMGASKEAAVYGTSFTRILIAVSINVVISILGCVYATDILMLMGASKEAALYGTSFTRIMMGSSIFIMLLFLINGIFRGAGNAAIAMKSLWLANIANIILCPVLINGFGPVPAFGLTGAAIATSIGRGIGVFYQLYHLFNGKGMLKMKLS